MTLKEIAQEAGVSVSTVSRVINNKNTKAASPEVQERIMAIVRRTGYFPNTAARNLKMGNVAQTTNTTPKSIACIYARTNTDGSDPFFSRINKAVELEALKSCYFIRHSFTSVDFNRADVLNQLTHVPVDGVVILGRYNQHILNFFKKHYKNVVYTGLNPMDFQYDQVVCEGRDIVYSVLTYLQELGHTQIGYIGEQVNEVRFIGYKESLTRLNLPFAQHNTVDINHSSKGGYDGMKNLIKNGDDLSAILCANDTTAVGVIHALQKYGFRIPEDISVISIDDIDIAQYLTPMLTTVHVPTEELGQMAAKTLIDRINGGHHLPMKICLPFYIAKRESCAVMNPDRRTFSSVREQLSF